MTTNDLTWNTALLYPAPDSPQLESDLGSFEALAVDFRDRYFEKIADLDAGAILTAVREYESLQVHMSKAFCYAHLLFADDSGNETYLALSQRCSELGNRERIRMLVPQVDAEVHVPAIGQRVDAACNHGRGTEYVEGNAVPHAYVAVVDIRPCVVVEALWGRVATHCIRKG